MLAVVALCWVAVGASASSADPGSVTRWAPGQTCPDVLVIGARGSGQEPGTPSPDSPTLGLGPEVYGFATHLAGVLGGETVAAWPNPYPAVDIFHITSLNQYFDSVDAGATNVQVMVSVVAQQCATQTRIVLAGFSQGANTTNLGLSLVPTADQSLIGAVILIADPTYDPNAGGQRLGNPANQGGILGRVAPPTWAQGRTTDVCLTNDVVCQSDTPTQILQNLNAGFGATIHTSQYQDPILQIGEAALVKHTLSSAGTGAIINADSCFANQLSANDDGSSPQVNLGFTLNYFGQSFSSLWVNNNGNVTFDSPLSTYTPFQLTTANRQIIAPFFGDVDTRGAGSDIVHYGYGSTVYDGHPAFCADWINVGYYAEGTDKLNSFQLLLVNRSDVAPGDFDIVFNYGHIAWETGSASGGSDGLGGASARVGYSNGVDRSFELPGSGTNGALLDSNAVTGLIHGSRNSNISGRYVFPVRNGAAATGHQIAGTVFNDATSPASLVAGAYVSACGTDGTCVLTTSSSLGAFALGGLPDGTYTVRVSPPGAALPASATVIVAGADTSVDLHVTGPAAPPPGTSLVGHTAVGSSAGLPTVYWNDPLTLSTVGCSGGTATYTLTVAGSVARTGQLNEVSPGHYQASIAALYPTHGDAHMQIAIIGCATPSAVNFDFYIDPSGIVEDAHGQPLAGVTVTLLRSGTSSGPFEAVPDGSAVMALSNRTNPTVTGSDGLFGWDVIPGFYRVRAEKAGCQAADGTSYAESDVLTIPPPVTDLVLRLDCQAHDATAPTITASGLTAITTTQAATVNYTFNATDPDDAVASASCAPAPGSTFPLGHTTVHCTATDSHGNSATQDFDVLVRTPVSFGDQAVERQGDSNQAGVAEAFRLIAPLDGQLSSLSVYLGSSTSATSAIVGVYADDHRHPGALIAKGTIGAPQPGGWNNVALVGGTVGSGQVVWVAIGGLGGSVELRDRCCGGGGTGPSETDAASGLTDLPTSWTSGTSYKDAPVSAYVTVLVVPPVPLIGNAAVSPSTDSDAAGQAEAFRATTSRAGTVAAISFYLDPDSASSKVIVGVYSDNNGSPGALLTEGVTTSPVAGAWNQLSLASPIGLSASTNYWIAVLSPVGAGKLRFEDGCCGGGGNSPSQASAQTSLSDLPQTWTPGRTYATDGPVSAFADAPQP